jgi:signal transduction histidine kinase
MNTPASRTSSTAQRLLALKDDVFAAWEARTRERIQQARLLQHPILIDTLPAFYNNIVESVDPHQPRVLALDGTTMATEHGGERARITDYSHASLIEEYQIFRWAIFDVLHKADVTLDLADMHAINASIDGGIREAVEGFSLVHSGFRERFAAALTHDMRGPLSATAMGLELVLKTGDLALAKSVAAKSLVNVRRMASMIDELLHTMAFHGGEGLQLTMSEFDMLDVVTEVVADAAMAHGPRFHVIGMSLVGHWDRPAMRRVMENLLSNAVKYGSPGTPITIKLEGMHERLMISVHNVGDPIPAAEQECIFQMYRRAEAAKHNAQAGWGIGLPYVRAVAESHGGSIGVDTSAERGTTFVFTAPLDGSMMQDAPTLEKGF